MSSNYKKMGFNKHQLLLSILTALLVLVAGCSKETEQGVPAVLLPQLESGCDAGSCHVIAPLQEFPPSSGKHSWHLNKFKKNYNGEIDSSICQNCHWDYYYDIQHRNNFIEGYDHINKLHKPGRITRFGGQYNGTDGIQVSAVFNTETDNCDNIACHPGPTLNWYKDTSNAEFWNFYCTDCHKPGSAIDPVTTNGSGNAGKHVAHVQKQKIKCETCHLGYRQQPTHMNGQFGTRSGARLIYFNDGDNLLREDGTPSPEPGRFATFDDQTDGSGSFTCSTGCHGTADWYSGAPSCLNCHNARQDNGDNIPPGGRRAIIPEFPTTDTHSHQGLTLDENTCLVCHDQSTHMDGVVDLWQMDDLPANTVNQWDGNVVTPTNTALDIYGFGANSLMADGFNVIRFVKKDDLMVPPWEDPNRNYPISTYSAFAPQVNFYSNNYNLSDFCLGCHDSNGPIRPGANPTDPFNAGNTPPDIRQYFAGTNSWVEDVPGHGGSKRVTNAHHDVLRSDQICNDGTTQDTATCNDANGNPPSGARLDCTGCHNVHMASLTNPVIEPHNPSVYFPYPTTPIVTGVPATDDQNRKDSNKFCLRCHAGNKPQDSSFPGTYRAGIIPNYSANTATFVLDDWIIEGAPQHDPYWMNPGDIIYGDWNAGTSTWDSKAIVLEGFTTDSDPADCVGNNPGVEYEGYGCALDQIWDDLDGDGKFDDGNWQADTPFTLAMAWKAPKSIKVQIIRDTNNYFTGGGYPKTIHFAYCSQFVSSCADPTAIDPYSAGKLNWEAPNEHIEYNGYVQLQSVTNQQTDTSDITVLRGLDSCNYTGEPYGVVYPWRHDYHGGDSKKQWTNQVYPTTYSNATVGGNPLEYEVLCLSCHHHHGTTNATSTAATGNLYMIREAVDGTQFVDDGSRQATGSTQYYTYSQPYGTFTGCDPGSEDCSVVIETPSLITPTAQPSWENLCYKCHFRYEPFNPLLPNKNEGHAGGGWSNMPCMNCHIHGGIANNDNFIEGNSSLDQDLDCYTLNVYCGNGSLDTYLTRRAPGVDGILNTADDVLTPISEECDDGNNLDGDGCSAICTNE